MDRLIDSPRPTVGLVVGTFAAAPYVHLQLEAARRFEPGLPVLVHDDASPQLGRLRELAREYGQECVSTDLRRSHFYGDMAALVEGLRWAESKGIELLVKFSRRFVPLYPWSADLRRLAFRLQYATYSSVCTDNEFGFRTECLAMHVPSWEEAGAAGEIRREVERERPVLVEAFVHDVARAVHARTQCARNRRLEALFPRDPRVAAYGDWWIGGVARGHEDPDVLWHHRNVPGDYAALARAWGLPYGEGDFQDPNVGMGIG